MIMFLDLNLPGMSGVDLCRLIRRKNGLHYPCPHGLCEHLRTDRVPRGWFR
jgi:CheY-like chemotaxis protein